MRPYAALPLSTPAAALARAHHRKRYKRYSFARARRIFCRFNARAATFAVGNVGHFTAAPVTRRAFAIQCEVAQFRGLFPSRHCRRKMRDGVNFRELWPRPFIPTTPSVPPRHSAFGAQRFVCLWRHNGAAMIPEHRFAPATPLAAALPGADADAPAAAAPGRRFWLGLTAAVVIGSAALILGSGAGQAAPYSVTVPVRLAPYDAAQWAVFDAQSTEAALALDPTLPRADAITLAGAAATPAALQLQEAAYVGPAARPFAFKGATALDASRAQYCLTAAIYYEAASETDNGMRGVAQTVLNRVRHPSFPGSVCGVVFQGSQRAGVCQFTFACDGAMARAPSAGGWARASRIAAEALAGKVFPSVGLATHYHTQAIWPRWGKSLVMTNIVGAHIFHRWRGRWGTPDAFRAPYAGREPVPGPYLPVAQQLAALGKGGAVAGTTPLPAGTAIAPMAPPVAGPAPAPGFSPAIVPVAPAPEPRATYADPRLSRSGQVREEYKKSGEWIR